MFDKFRTYCAIAELNRIDQKTKISERDLEKRGKHIKKLVDIGEAALPQLMMKLSSNNVMTPGAAIPTVIYRIGEVSIPHLINVAKKKDKLASDSATKILGEIATDKALAALGELAEVASLSEIANSALGEASFRRKHRERLEKRSKFMLFKRRT